MIKVRKGTFETNSSSTHSITICDSDIFNRWKRGDGNIIYSSWGGRFLTKDEVEKEFEKHNNNPNNRYKYNDLEDYMHDEGMYSSYSDYLDSVEMETYEEYYTTKSGDQIVAFGYYGYDG